MIIFDEVHLVSDTATTLRKVLTSADPKKPLLGLTATIDEQDPRYNTILSLLPPVRRYMIGDAVKDKRLARPVVIPIKVDLTHDEKKIYVGCSIKIRNISGYLHTSDPKSITSMLRRGGRSAGESIQRLKEMLQNKGIKSMLIDSKLNSKKRQIILSEWGKEFFPLLSVHTLEIGYDVPEVRVAIILATSSNMNQIVQRIGRTLDCRKRYCHDTYHIPITYT